MQQDRSENRQDAATIRVLIVEDEPAAREACARYLGRRGYDVAAAAGAEEAFAAAREQPPDVIVCDWRLGVGGNGVEVARTLQSDCGAPIIFITAYPIDELRNQTRDLRVLRHFRKPLALNELADVIASVET